jgi:hypothetical protein
VYKNKLTNVIRAAKKTYYTKAFINSQGNMKKTWSVIKNVLSQSKSKNNIKSILINNREVTAEIDMAEEFNTYFTTVAAELESNIPPSDICPLTNVSCNVPHSFFIYAVNVNEISNLILKLKKTSGNINTLPVKILIKVRDILSPPIANLINKSFSAGIFPSLLKCATVTPVFKSGNPMMCESYRPISVLPTISKIFERAMYSRLIKFIDKHSLISNCQFGFRKGKSTAEAVLRFVNYIYDSLNCKKHSLSIFIDLKKAYDTVNHTILLNKLQRYGIRGLPQSWFKSYLSDRKQNVKIGISHSSVRTVKFGVPQGSILAPLLFLVYINDLPALSKLFSCILFADDTTLSLCDESYLNLITTTNTELEKINQWTVSNRLSLNINKTAAMIFSNRPHDQHELNILLNNEKVTVYPHFKFLGIDIDNKLKFNYHITSICNKLSKSIGIIYKLKQCLPPEAIKNLYYNFVYPYILYCNIVWGGTYDAHLQPLILLQKRIVRLISDETYLAHTNPLFNQNKILKLADIHNYTLALHVFKSVQSGTVVNEYHDYNTRQTNDRRPIFQRLTLSQHSPSYTAPHVWNSLPENI